MQFDPAIEELSKKVPPYLIALESLLPDKSKVLFVRQTSLALLKRLQQDRKMDISIIDRNIANSAIYQKYNITSYTGDAIAQISKFTRQSFDYVIFDNSLLSFTDIQSAIVNSSIIAEHIIVILENLGHWKNRLNFLFGGSFFTKPEDWYTAKSLRFCNIKEFMTLCSNTELIIERACYFDSKGFMHNLYDIKKLPGIFAQKLMFIAGHRDNYLNMPITYQE